MIPSKIKIESFAKRCHMGRLGGKGLIGVIMCYEYSNAITACLTGIEMTGLSVGTGYDTRLTMYLLLL